MKIYAISGLGADESVFKALTLDFPLQCIQWIEPKPNESLNEYAFRLSDQIDTAEEFILLGVSFGGMLAVALQNIVQPKLTLLISSARNKYDLPWLYRWIGKTNIIRWIPHQWMILPNSMAVWLFGAEQKSILFDIINDTDLKFLKWALQAIASWEEDKKDNTIFRIHGIQDKLIPYKESSRSIAIENTGHFMIVDRADELSKIINARIKEL